MKPSCKQPFLCFLLKCEALRSDSHPSWWWKAEPWRPGPEKPLQLARFPRPSPPPCSPAAGCVPVRGWRWTLLCLERCRGEKQNSFISLEQIKGAEGAAAPQQIRRKKLVIVSAHASDYTGLKRKIWLLPLNPEKRTRRNIRKLICLHFATLHSHWIRCYWGVRPEQTQ